MTILYHREGRESITNSAQQNVYYAYLHVIIRIMCGRHCACCSSKRHFYKTYTKRQEQWTCRFSQGMYSWQRVVRTIFHLLEMFRYLQTAKINPRRRTEMYSQRRVTAGGLLSSSSVSFSCFSIVLAEVKRELIKNIISVIKPLLSERNPLQFQTADTDRELSLRVFLLTVPATYGLCPWDHYNCEKLSSWC